MSFTPQPVFGNADASAQRAGTSPHPPNHSIRHSSDHARKASYSSLKRTSTSGSQDVDDSTRARSSSMRRRPSFRNEESLATDDGEKKNRVSAVPELPKAGVENMEKRGSSYSDDGLMEEEDARREEEVHQLARRLTKQSTYSNLDANPLEASADSQLNPNSPNFSAKAWARSLVNLQERDPDQNPMRTAGVAFRNLNVYGYGAATDYQKTVANIWLQAAGAVRKLFGGQQRRIDILRNFDGIVNAGEMLVVLGPPGSGQRFLPQLPR
jgi:ATP-binding cassette, subfamily G (WHITE), member 2, PDR